MGNKQTIAQAKYDSTHCRIYKMKLNLVNDADIVEKLETVGNIQGYIKQCIRKELLAKEKESNEIHD